MVINRLFLVVLYVFFSASITFAESQLLGDIEEVARRLKLTYEQRQEYIHFSEGSLKLSLQCGKSVDYDKASRSARSAYTGQMRLKSIIGTSEWNVDWYQKDDKRRHDILVENQNANKDSFLGNKNMRIAYDREKSIYYDVTDEMAYINRRPSLVTKPFQLTSNFDIDYFYGRGCMGGYQKVWEYITKQNDNDIEPEISLDTKDGTIQLKYNKQTTTKHGKPHKVIREINICPKRFIVLSHKVYNNEITDYEDVKLVSSYEAEFEESKDYKGIWLIKNVKIYNLNYIKEELLTCKFENMKIGVDLPDEMFSFDGLGVPVGTRVHDRSFGGQPIQFYYKAYPFEKINNVIDNLKEIDNVKESNFNNDIYIPRMSYALKNKLPYIYDLKNCKIVNDSKNAGLANAHKELNSISNDCIMWDLGFLTGKDIDLLTIGKTSKLKIQKNDSRLMTYLLPDESELPLEVIWERKGNDSHTHNYRIILQKIEKNGIWVKLKK